MTVRITSPAEAFAAITAVTIAADGVGSVEERNTVLARAKTLDVFKAYDQAAFAKLLATVTNHLCEVLPQAENGAFTRAGVDSLLVVVAQHLDAAQRAAAIELAIEISRSDDEVASEVALVSQLRKGLGVN